MCGAQACVGALRNDSNDFGEASWCGEGASRHVGKTLDDWDKSHQEYTPRHTCRETHTYAHTCTITHTHTHTRARARACMHACMQGRMLTARRWWWNLEAPMVMPLDTGE